MKEHKYFSIGYASHIANPKDGMCIFAGEAPTRNDNGSTSFSLRAPMVLISEVVGDRYEIAKTVEAVLNENAHRFFSSAANSQSQDEEPQRGDTDGAEQRTPA